MMKGRLVRVLSAALAPGLSAASLVITGSSACGQVIPPTPTIFELRQNDPDPFCPTTRIEMVLPQNASVRLEILQPMTQTVLRTLVDGMLAAGVHSVLWNGQGSGGMLLPDDAYPYRMTARDASQYLLFEATRTAHLECVAPVVPERWTRVKRLYR